MRHASNVFPSNTPTLEERNTRQRSEDLPPQQAYLPAERNRKTARSTRSRRGVPYPANGMLPEDASSGLVMEAANAREAVRQKCCAVFQTPNRQTRSSEGAYGRPVRHVHSTAVSSAKLSD